jgi:hypothetical protein
LSVQICRTSVRLSDHKDAIQISHCPNPGDIGGDMTILVSTIMKQHQKILFTSSQYTWRTPKTVSIGTMTSGTYSRGHGNDFRISLVKIDPAALEIWLVVPLSSE